MNKKTIYFHIGTHKTGSTAIQKFLLDNENILKERKYIYSLGIKNGINHMDLSHDVGLWDSIELDPACNYIFSSEDFYFSFFREKENINLLEHLKFQANKFKSHNIKVVIYLRRQDLFSQSLNNEIIKRHGFTKNYSYDVVPLNYYEKLKTLSLYLGNHNIFIRPYEHSQFIGVNIYSDFLKTIDLDPLDNYTIEDKVVNPSLTTEKMEFTRYINMLNLPVGFRNQISRLIIKSALDSNEVSLFRKQDLISPEDAKELLAKYEEGNQKIAKEFLGRKDGKLFYEDIAEDPNWKPFPGLTQSIAQKILQKMAELDKSALERLYHFIMKTSDRNEEFVQSANFLMPLLINVLGNNVDFSPFTASTPPKTQNPYSKLKEQLNTEQDSADILREVAFSFEQSGDIQTACKVMEQAHLLRPEGPVIKQKLEEYRKKLNEKSTSTSA